MRTRVLFELGFLVLVAARVPADECPVEVGRWPFGPTRTVTATGSTAFIGSGAVLMVVDGTNPEHPSILGEVRLPGLVNGIAVSESFAYVANGGHGVRVVDVSDRSAPVEVGSVDSPGVASGIAFSEGLLFLADGHDGGLRVIDAAVPDGPVEIGSIDTPGGALGVAVSGRMAIVADGGMGIRVIDVSNPSTPVELGHWEPDEYGGEVSAVALSGDYAFASGGFEEGFIVIDIGSPSAPSVVARTWTEGAPRDAAIVGSTAWVVDGTGLVEIDVTSPHDPTIIGSLETPGGAVEVSVVGDVAYVADTSEGLRLIDGSHPEEPIEIGSLTTYREIFELTVSGNKIYQAERGGNLRIVDVYDPSNPLGLGAVDLCDSIKGLAANQTHVFAGCQESDNAQGRTYRTSIVDVSNPGEPAEEGFLATSGSVVDIAVSNDTLLIVSLDTGRHVRLVDVSVPSSPNTVGWYSLRNGRHVYSIAVSGAYAYICWRTSVRPWSSPGGVDVVDISDPSDPDLVGRYESTGGLGDIAVSGSLAYVLKDHHPDYTLHILDVSAPLQPTEVGVLEVGSTATTVDAFGAFVFIDGSLNPEGFLRGMRVIDVSTPSNPVVVGGFEVLGILTGMAASDVLTLADWRAGLVVLGPCQPLQPVRPTAAFEVHTNGRRLIVTDRSTGAPTRWQWDFGDGSTSTEPSPSHDYPSPGYYEVSLTVGNQAGEHTTKKNLWISDESACSPVWVAAAASTNGVGGTRWVTDLTVNNLSNQPLSYAFQMLPRGQNNLDQPLQQTFNLEANKSVGYHDVWRATTGEDGGGAINVCVDHPEAIGVFSRTYNLQNDGTFGQGIKGIGNNDGLVSAGTRVRLGSLHQSESFRTNIGFMNATNSNMMVFVEFWRSDGTVLGLDFVRLAPFENRQWGSAFSRVSDEAVENGFADVWTNKQGALFLTYASVVDQHTGDPVTIWPY